MAKPKPVPPPGAYDDFHFSVAAIWAQWTGGRIAEDAAMAAISDALTELRERTEAEPA